MIALEAFNEGVIFDLGPEVVGVRLDSIVTPVGCRNDHGEHFALRPS